MKKLINRALAAKKTNFFFMALLCAGSMLANEATPQTAIQETTIEETAYLGVDTIIMGEDTVFVPVLPRPIHLDMHALRKATTAEACLTDSVIGLDTDGNYASRTEFEYDAAGHTIAKIDYKWENGVMKGVSRYWKVYTGSTATTTVNYNWNATTAQWDGKDSTVLKYYSDGKQSSTEKYAWENGAWRYSSLVEYEYDAVTKKETLTRTSSWNATAGALVYSTKREHEYDASGRTLVDASWKYTNNAWVGTGMNKWEYDEKGNNTVMEVYNGWENNTWKGKANGKTTYEYNAAKKVTQKIIYTWSAGAWVEASKEETQYDGSNVSDLAKYTWKNSAWEGSSRTSTTYTSGKKTEELIWKWNGAWEWNTKTEYIYSGSNVCEQTPLKWDGTAWIGNGSKWKKTFVFTNKVETQTYYTWATDKWVESTKDSTKWISSSLSESTTNYKWQDDAWVGIKKVRNTYNKSNKPISNETLAWGGNEDNWRDSLHTLYEYNESNVEILKVNAKKVGEEWQAIDSTKREIEYVTVAGQKKTKSDASAKWTAKSGVWTGTGTKYRYEYDGGANVILSVTHTFSSGAWVYKDSALFAYKDNKSSQKMLDETWSYNATTQSWKGNHKYQFEFDDAGHTILSTYYNSYDTDRNDWGGDQKNEQKYNAKGELISSVNYLWNNTLWQFVGSSRIDYNLRDAAGNIVEQVKYDYEIATNKWVESEKEESEYSSSGEQIYLHISKWSLLKNDWCDSILNESSYDKSDGKIRRVSEEEYTNCNADPVWKAEKQYYYSCDTYWKILFVDWDGKEIANLQVLDSETPKNPGKQTREADKQYTYEFTGWGEKIVAATENKTYTAHYEATPRKYTVTFYDEDGVTVRDSQKDVEYGATPVYGGPELSKESTAQYTYAFSQWGDNGVKAVEGDTSYIAHYAATLRQYTVIFANYDNKPLQSSLVDYGTKPAYTGETPAKASDVQYTYTFTGWDPEIADVTGAATYTAKFSETTNQYTVKFYADEAKENLLYSNAFDFGTMPEYSGETPAKAGDAQYSYAFVGWGDNGMKTVTGDTAYIAKFSQSVNQYTVAFYADEAKENLLYSNQFSYGATPEYQGETPAKEGDAQYSYTFSGWSDGIVAVTGDTAYIAQFSQSVNQYTVKFYADEAKENLLYSNEFAYGAMPEYQGETPAKAGDAQYSYTFSGWSDGIVAVTGDTAYIAKFDATVNTYSITFEVKGNSALKHTIDNVPYGTLVNDLVAAVKTALGGDSFEDENYIYTFAGIEDLTETDIVTGDETFYVLYTATPKTTTGLENIQQAAPATKVFENGVMYILRDGKKYTMQGEVVD